MIGELSPRVTGERKTEMELLMFQHESVILILHYDFMIPSDKCKRKNACLMQATSRTPR